MRCFMLHVKIVQIVLLVAAGPETRFGVRYIEAFTMAMPKSVTQGRTQTCFLNLS